MKPKYSLILDDEFIQYCNLNNISDIEGFAKKVFIKGFTLIKYGDIVFSPTSRKQELVSDEIVPIVPLSYPIISETPLPVDSKSKNVQKTDKVYDE